MKTLELEDNEAIELEQLLIDVVYGTGDLPLEINQIILFDLLTKVENMNHEKR